MLSMFSLLTTGLSIDSTSFMKSGVSVSPMLCTRSSPSKEFPPWLATISPAPLKSTLEAGRLSRKSGKWLGWFPIEFVCLWCWICCCTAAMQFCWVFITCWVWLLASPWNKSCHSVNKIVWQAAWTRDCMQAAGWWPSRVYYDTLLWPWAHWEYICYNIDTFEHMDGLSDLWCTTYLNAP